MAAEKAEMDKQVAAKQAPAEAAQKDCDAAKSELDQAAADKAAFEQAAAKSAAAVEEAKKQAEAAAARAKQIEDERLAAERVSPATCRGRQRPGGQTARLEGSVRPSRRRPEAGRSRIGRQGPAGRTGQNGSRRRSGNRRPSRCRPASLRRSLRRLGSRGRENRHTVVNFGSEILVACRCFGWDRGHQ